MHEPRNGASTNHSVSVNSKTTLWDPTMFAKNIGKWMPLGVEQAEHSLASGWTQRRTGPFFLPRIRSPLVFSVFWGPLVFHQPGKYIYIYTYICLYLLGSEFQPNLQDEKLIQSEYGDYLLKLSHVSQSCRLLLREEGGGNTSWGHPGSRESGPPPRGVMLPSKSQNVQQVSGRLLRSPQGTPGDELAGPFKMTHQMELASGN